MERFANLNFITSGLSDVHPGGFFSFYINRFLPEASKMKQWYREDWCFIIRELRVGKTNRYQECRLGYEVGDTFECKYETPAGFCPVAFMKLYPLLEVVRCGGDLRQLGSSHSNRVAFICPDEVVLFEVIGSNNNHS